MNRNDRRWRGLLLGVCLLALLGWMRPLAAQDQPAAAEAAPAAETSEESVGVGDEELLGPDEIDALVAPIVLFPDPLLVLVLQAAISPLDIVEAQRFLERREKDPTLTPDPDWDSSVVGLLNYPQLIGSMSEYLDWTQLLGSAVVDELDAVQVSIQGIRGAAMDQGILVSDERQKVVIVNDLIVIAPADKNTISVPQYDPLQLMAAITPADEVIDEEPAEPAVGAEAVPEPPATKPEEPPVEEAAPAEETPPAEPAPAQQAYAEPAPAPVAAPAPTYYAEPTPVYAAPPPPISYAAPQSTFWSSAATFAGGAAVGGLLGYVWGDDDNNNNNNDDGWDDVEDAIRDIDDDDWDDFADRIDDDDFDDFVDRIDDRDWDEARDRWKDGDFNGGKRDINISDSNIVVGNNVKHDQLNAKLKNKRENKLNVARGGDRAKLDLKNGTLKREGGVNVGDVGNRVGGDKPRRPPGLAPANLKRDRPSGAQNVPGGLQSRAKTRDVKLPGASGLKEGAAGQNRQRAGQQVAQNRPQRPAAAAGQGQRQEKALAAARRPGAQPQAAANRKVAAGIDNPREVRRDANRGASSKAKAGLKPGSRPQATAQRTGGGQRAAQAQPQRQAAAGANRGGNRPMGGVKSGGGAKRDSNRGKQSLGKGGGGRKGGGGKRGKN